VIGRLLVRRGRFLWWWMIGTAAWRNRRDLLRWWGFARSAVADWGTRSVDELVTEARVRAAVTADPTLRQDPGLQDVRVRDGVVTLATTAAEWPPHVDPVRRLEKVKGVAAVHTEWSPAVAGAASAVHSPLASVPVDRRLVGEEVTA
jgi:hypothetical protein